PTLSVSATGQPHPFEEASFGVSCSSVATPGDGALNTTSRRAPTRATSTRAGRRADDDMCRPTCSPGHTDCGQQYPVTTSRPIARPYSALVAARHLGDRAATASGQERSCVSFDVEVPLSRRTAECL